MADPRAESEPLLSRARGGSVLDGPGEQGLGRGPGRAPPAAPGLSPRGRAPCGQPAPRVPLGAPGGTAPAVRGGALWLPGGGTSTCPVTVGETEARRRPFPCPRAHAARKWLMWIQSRLGVTWEFFRPTFSCQLLGVPLEAGPPSGWGLGGPLQTGTASPLTLCSAPPSFPFTSREGAESRSGRVGGVHASGRYRRGWVLGGDMEGPQPRFTRRKQVQRHSGARLRSQPWHRAAASAVLGVPSWATCLSACLPPLSREACSVYPH